MRLGVDVRYLSHGLVGGVHTYVRQLVPALIDVTRDHQLMQFFARPYACVNDGDVDLGAKATHTDHFSCKIIDTDAFACAAHTRGSQPGAVAIPSRILRRSIAR